MRLVWLMLAAVSARAAVPVVPAATAANSVEMATPETEVEISIYDLVKRKPVPHLPADYGQRVAAAIERERPRLVDCLGTDAKASWPVRLAIARRTGQLAFASVPRQSTRRGRSRSIASATRLP